MGQPEKPCRRCKHYIRRRVYGGPKTYGGCSLRREAVHANATGCKKWEANDGN
jgi:hypothetical protein